MKRVILLTSLLLVNRPVMAATVDSNDTVEILFRLLNIKNPNHNNTDDNGLSRYDSLGAYKVWEEIYLKYARSNERKTPKLFDKDNLKILLLIGYIAKNNNDAAILESFFSDLLSIYIANRQLSLEILKELPFMVPSTCFLLSKFFGWEGKNLDQKQPFLASNGQLISDALGVIQGSACLKFFTKSVRRDR